VRAELLADTSRGPVATDVDDLGALIVAELARRGGQDPKPQGLGGGFGQVAVESDVAQPGGQRGGQGGQLQSGRSCRVRAYRPRRLWLDLIHSDPLAALLRVPALTAPDAGVDLARMPVGRTETGGAWVLRLLDRHVLVGRAERPGPVDPDGRVQVFGIDPGVRGQGAGRGHQPGVGGGDRLGPGPGWVMWRVRRRALVTMRPATARIRSRSRFGS